MEGSPVASKRSQLEILALLLLTPCTRSVVAQSCTYAPPATVSENYDRFRDQTVVRLDRLGFGPPIPVYAGVSICYFATSLLIEATFSGRTADTSLTVRLILITLSPVGDSPDFILLLNGVRRVPLKVLGVEDRSQGNMTAHHVVADLPRLDLVDLVSAESAEIAVGPVEVSLTSHDLATIRDFSARLLLH